MGVLRDNLAPTDFADAVCKVTDWSPFPYHGYESVRVWICQCGNHWFQRHEWVLSGANSTQLDDWLYSGYSNTRRFPAHLIIDGLALLKESQI